MTNQSFWVKDNDLLSRKFKSNKIYTEQEKNNDPKCEDRQRNIILISKKEEKNTYTSYLITYTKLFHITHFLEYAYQIGLL